MYATPFVLQPTPTPLMPAVEAAKGVRFCVCTNQGQRAHQEDRYIATELGDVAVCAVMDGHVGAAVATHVQSALLDQVPVLEMLDFSDTQAVVVTLVKLFQKIDADIVHKGGSTAVLALYHKRQRLLYMVNLGDSRGVAVDVTNGLWAATVDHKPSDPSEKERIRALGGYVTTTDSVTRVQGYLSVSRAFGDFDLRPFVSADPVMYGPYLVTGTAVVVLCSDGVTDALDNASIVHAVTNRASGSYKTLCTELVHMALRRGSTDNATAVAMVIN